MNKNKKWLIAVSVATMITANGLVLAAASAVQPEAANGKRPFFAEKGSFKGGMKAFDEEKAKLLELLQVNDETLKSELKAGKTLAAIAQDHGVSEAELKNFMVARMTQRLDEGVKSGKISAEQAVKIKADMEKHVTDIINGKGRLPKANGPRPGHGPFDNTKLLALLNIDEPTLKNELKAGKTLAAVANEHGVSEAQLKDFLVGQMTERLDEGVKSGKFPTEQAEKMKARLAEHVAAMITGEGPMHKVHDRKSIEPITI